MKTTLQKYIAEELPTSDRKVVGLRLTETVNESQPQSYGHNPVKSKKQILCIVNVSIYD